MGQWLTQPQAAALLGVHRSAVPKLVARGALTPRTARPSLPLAQVLKLAAERADAAAERELRRTTPRPPGPRRPDDEHEWLLAPAAAAVLGCTVGALRARAVRGRVPSTVVARQRWFRLDLLELAVRAQVARERRHVSR